jgi:hypothetical protein
MGTPALVDGAVRAAIESITVELQGRPDRHAAWGPSGRCRETAAGAAQLAGGDEELMALAIAALREAGRFGRDAGQSGDGRMMRLRVGQDLAACALRRKLPWTPEQLAELLDALAGNARRGYLMVAHDPVKPVVLAVERCVGHSAPPELHTPLRALADLIRLPTADDVKVIRRVLALLGDIDGDGPLPGSEDPWSAALLAARAVGDRAELADRLLALAPKATAGKPGKQFAAARDQLVAEHGPEQVAPVAAALLTAACRVPAVRDGAIVPGHVGDVLRGLAWIAAAAGGEDAARALGDLAVTGWRKVPSHGPLCSKAANAALGALAELPEGAGQLGRVRAQLKQPAAQRTADAAIDRAAERLGIPRDEFEERVVPDFGLGADSTCAVAVGEYTATLALTAASSCELRFAGPSGRPLKAPPAAVRRDHAEQLATLKQAVKDIKVMAAAQKLRLERLLVADRSWEQRAWREHYLDHGLVGVLARRLIWTVKLPDGPRSAIVDPDSGTLVDAAGEPVDARDAPVSLWHPVDAEPADVHAWRRFLEDREIRQPFKQAHREVYVLTDAERATGSYSNRFAAHVLRQHQMAALARARGWTYALQGAWDTPDEHAQLRLPEHGLRVSFWTQRPFDTEDWNDAGVFVHVLTDQVRFHTLDGADAPVWRRDGTAGTVALDTVPTRAFSEAMRDVDLFVGVTSIGNDPTWADRGDRVEDRHRVNEQYDRYWTEYALGELSEAATVRHDLLDRLLPKLAIADRVRLDGRFLRVRGSIREYKIHLGSGNILMEPNDAYLCIVRGRDAAVPDKVFLPFDGDPVLDLVLSKAFMLAHDDEITDPTITSQIRL